MSPTPNEILPEQRPTLEALRASIQTDANAQVQAEAGPLEQAINTNDRTNVVSALRTLEARLESLSAVQQHSAKLKEAKLAVGFMTDDIDTHIEGALDTTKSVIVDPLVNMAKENVPGAAEALDAMKPSMDSAKEMYAKLPTALRLPVLGAVIAGGSWIASYPVKWLGSLVGFVSEGGQKALESIAEKMKGAGKIALTGGAILGGASLFGSMYRQGTFDPALDSLKSGANAPASPGSSPVVAPGAPQAPSQVPNGPSYDTDTLKSGVDIDGVLVKFIEGLPGLEVSGKQWKVVPNIASDVSARMENGTLIVRGSVMLFSSEKRFSSTTVSELVKRLASSALQQERIYNDDGSASLASLERV